MRGERQIEDRGRPLQIGTLMADEAGIPFMDVRNLPLRLIEGMPADSYIRGLQDKLLDVRYHRMTDRRVIAAGTTVPAGKYQFFDKKIHSAETSIDGSIAIADKTQDYTNMLDDGKIAGGNTMIVESLQCGVFIPHRDFNAFTANTGLPSTGAPSATDTNSATNSLLALHLNTYLTFSEPDFGVHAEGSVLDFPADRVINANYGGATSEGLVQIGVGQPEYLRYVRVLQENHHFDVELEFFRATTFPISVVIDMALVGQRLF